ncbi:MAG: VWA domain-containing protein [Acidobacteria bacterium]|nr:VWA domain-containing protein [Acidobacteriota bacterium]
MRARFTSFGWPGLPPLPRSRQQWARLSPREKGMAVMITAAMLTFVVPAVGLAVDASMLYGVRARLSTATDAAALAAARSLSSGLTLSAQETAAVDTAQRFLNANFPPNYMYSTNRTVSISVAETGTRTRTVSVDVRVDSPSYFLRYLGSNMTALRAVGTASRRDVNVMMVLDRSGSLSSSGACTPMKNAATSFVQKFANYRDRVGLLTYGGDHRVDFPMQSTPGNFLSGTGSIPDLISKISCTGATNSAQALWNAYQQLKTINEAGSLNVILFFTDGQPNTLTFDFTAANAMRTVARGYTAAAPTSPPSTSKITALSRSSCSTTTNKVGWVTNDSASGRTYGIFNYIATTMPAGTSAVIPDRTNCVFNMSGGNTYIYGDFGFMPPTDLWGNAVSDNWYKPVTLINTVGSPDIGKVRISDGTTMINAGFNAANDAARRIRNNATSSTALNTVIYSIGLGGVGAAEDEFLNRVSNTRTSPIYDATKAEGLYVYAPTSAQLGQAFAQIAGEILRIAR